MPLPRRKRTAVLFVGSLVAVTVATGLAAIALASGKRVKPRPPAITGNLRLTQSEVHSGRTVRGELVFENHTAKTMVLLRGCRINGVYGVGLRGSEGYVQAPVFTLVGCSPEPDMVAKPGITVYRFNVSTTYGECTPSTRNEPPRSSNYWSPLCLKDSGGERNVMPPLPAGTYAVLFFPNGKWHGPQVKPAHLVISRAS